MPLLTRPAICATGSGAARMGNGEWRVHDIGPSVAVRRVRDMPPLAPGLEAEIDRLWAAAQARVTGRLFNGRVFSADTITPHEISGHWTEFRRIVAQMDRPDLGAALRVRPLSAGGLITGGSGAARFVVFGRRPAGAVYQPGEWQLPPAGSVDPGAVGPDGAIDPVRQLRAELTEELGLPGEAVTAPRPLCIVEHPGSAVLDFGIAVHTALAPAAIHAAHAAHGNGEYDPLECVPLAELPAFLARHAGRVTGQARLFLARAGLLAG